jgi:hypothetical protein
MYHHVHYYTPYEARISLIFSIIHRLRLHQVTVIVSVELRGIQERHLNKEQSSSILLVVQVTRTFTYGP